MKLRVSQHLHVAKWVLTMLGAWPWQFSAIVNIIYLGYYYALMGTLLLFMVFQNIEVVKTFTNEDWEGLKFTLSVALTYMLGIARIYYCRSRKIYDLIKRVQDTEQELEEGADDETIAIYNDYALRTKRSCIIYILIGVSAIIIYMFMPCIRYMHSGKILPILGFYFPYNKSEHVVAYYVVQLIPGIIGSCYAVFPDFIFFSLMIFCLGQIKVFQNLIRRIGESCLYLQMNHGVTKLKAEQMYIGQLARKHQSIIECIHIMDTTLRTFMMFEYFSFSLKLALIILQILEFSMDITRQFMYAMTMFCGLSIYYWNANEIILESSEGVIRAIFHSEWLDLEISTKKHLIFMIRRSQNALCFSIGPYYVMSLQACLQVFKTIYTFICLIKGRS